MVEKQTGSFVQRLRSDGGGEYFPPSINNFLEKHGIQRQFPCKYTHQQNGVVERKNKHIVEVARALMSAKNMSPCYWAEAASTTVYTMNGTPTTVVYDMTSEETFTGKKPDVSHFKVFGCIAYMHVPNELRTKLDPKAEKYVFIDHCVEQKGYNCYKPVTCQMRSQVVLSGPQGSPASSHVANPWSGRLRKEVSPTSSINVSRKGKEKVDEGMRLPNATVGPDDVDGHSSGSEYSLDEEFGIPSVRTPMC
ncbi:hypothetical protein L7F22_029601 [Adiantum nelumboides]|nr:hypothetical protein [Adiantum nelumboides]